MVVEASKKAVDAAEDAEKTKNWSARWAETRAAFGNIPAVFRLSWRADKLGTILMALVTLFQAMLPIGQAWVNKAILDSVAGSFGRHTTLTEGLAATVPFVLFEFVIVTIARLAAQLNTLLQQTLNARLVHSLSTEIIQKIFKLDLAHFEDSVFYDKLQNARREVSFRPMQIVNSSFAASQNFITLVSTIFILLTLSPLIAAILFLTSVPSFVSQARYTNIQFRLLNWRAPESRRRSYLEYLLTNDQSIKEIKLFGLGQTFLDRYNQLFWKAYDEDLKLARRRSIMSVLWGMVNTVSFYGAYFWIIARTLQGANTLGDMIFYLSLFRQSQGSFQALFSSVGTLYEGSLFMNNLRDYMAQPSSMKMSEAPHDLPPTIQQGIEFRHVWFRYPDKEKWVLEDLNLHIAPGEKIALVGANGAGKTTLVKLLTRLYDPTEGEILLDGIDLRDYDQTELHQKIGVIFQDFVRYQVTLRENIAFGQIRAYDDHDRVVEAARRAGADKVAEKLPTSYDTMLGGWFEKGQQLSGGEWQKVALGRAFMRDSEVLVLDEPTAALDAEREYEIFQSFRELTAGKIALLISHRFSTVRMADRIAVIEQGRLIELGSHQELLAQAGTYARLFNLQAEGYR